MKIVGPGPGLLPRLPFRRRADAARAVQHDPRGAVLRPAPAPPRPAGQSGPEAPAGVVLIPAEEMLLVPVALPRVSAAQRQKAAAFAVEDRIATPLDQVAVRLIGPAPDPGAFLVAVLGREVLARHAAHAPAPVRLVPEALALPVPPPGCAVVWSAPTRAVVRLADGSGLAVPRAMLPLLHRLAGGPQLILAAGTLPDGMEPAALPLPDAPPLPPVDLRSGSRTGGARWLGALAAAVVAAHLALAGASVLTLNAAADRAEAELRAALQSGGWAVSGDVDAALAQALAPAPQTGGGLLPLLGQVAQSMTDTGGAALLRDIVWTGATGRLSLTVEAPDLGALQDLQADLAARGLTAVPGGTEASGGLSVMRLTVEAP